jgi:FkbM family methyltransferase
MAGMAAHEPMISYAQNFEDVVLARVFADAPCGFYVDVGANHPENDSLTKHFSDRGWHGINVEPGRYFADLAASRPRDVNLNVAVSNVPGPATFYEGASPGLASLSPEVPESMRFVVGERTTRIVPVRPLRDILAEHAADTSIDFLSIDVEGHERSVILSGDWRRFRPRVLVIEATLPGTSMPCHGEWEPLLLEADYRFVYFDGLNRFYVRGEDERVLRPRFGPPCVFDRFITAETAKLRAGHPDVSAAVKELTSERDWLARQVNHLQSRVKELERMTDNIGHRSLRLGLWLARRLSALKRRVA